MAPAEKHFVIFKATNKGIIIATLIHGNRNIEIILKGIGSSLEDEIAQLGKILLSD